MSRAPVTPLDADDLLTVPECAAALDVSVVHVYRLVHAGALRSVPAGPRRALRFRPADLSRYLAGRRRAADAEAARAARVAAALGVDGGAS